MSRLIYTYTDLTKINKSQNFMELMKYPQIVVSTDLRKSLNGSMDIDKVNGLVSGNVLFKVTEFQRIASAIDEEWNSDHSKFGEMIFLSEFMREKMRTSSENRETCNWLLGCMRNMDSMLSAIILLEQAAVRPDEIEAGNDRNMKLFLEAWKYVAERDKAINIFRSKMDSLKVREAWKEVFRKAFNLELTDSIDTLVLHGFYYITPFQERVFSLLEESGFKLIFLIPYDERYPYSYEIWDETYGDEGRYVPKNEWHIEKSFDTDSIGMIFEGKRAEVNNQLSIKEYASVMEFVDAVDSIKEEGYSIYSSDFKAVNMILKDYFPDKFGDRKILAYPIGQFISILNSMWDDDIQKLVMTDEDLIELFSSGWLAAGGISAKQYLQDLMYVLPFFKGCRTFEEWSERLMKLMVKEKSVKGPFEVIEDPDPAIQRWQKSIGNPFTNFSMFAVDTEKISIIIKLIRQLLNMARELFGKNEPVKVSDYVKTLDGILKKYEVSQDLYEEERELVKDIFESLKSDNGFDTMCRPSDMARALELFINGRFEEGELQTNKVGIVYPLYFVDAACVKNQGKVHICMCDIERLPGRNRDYIWPLTGKKVREIYESTGNALLLNLMHVMESAVKCNRYFIYCALKNKDVTLSWVSLINEKIMAPSPYIKLILENTDIKINPSSVEILSDSYVADIQESSGRIKEYDFNEMPMTTLKDAKMDYALCPMKYVLSYVVEKYPVYQSDFQMTFLLNACISAISGLMRDDGVSIDDIYDAVMDLFPNMRKVEKRQVYDYIAYDRKENEIDYENRTKCGDRYYTDERMKLKYLDKTLRHEAFAKYRLLNTPSGRKGLNLNEMNSDKANFCMYCQHINYCRNAVYPVDMKVK